MKYKFSEITRRTGWSFEKDWEKDYMCQVFDEDGNYICCLFGDTYNEVRELQKKYK